MSKTHTASATIESLLVWMAPCNSSGEYTLLCAQVLERCVSRIVDSYDLLLNEKDDSIDDFVVFLPYTAIAMSRVSNYVEDSHSFCYHRKSFGMDGTM